MQKGLKGTSYDFDKLFFTFYESYSQK